MRIVMTDRYAFERDWHCEELAQCDRHYCRIHRILWRTCDTIKRGVEGDLDVIGGIHSVYELGECPSCEAEARAKRYERLVKEAV